MDLNLGYTQTIISVAKDFKATKAQCAYILATAYWETARSMAPIKETVMPHHKNKNPPDSTVIARLNTAFEAGRLGQVRNPYWQDGWFGRGFVQLTHQTNYERAGRELGVDLVGNPDLALDPDIAAKVLVKGMIEGWFTGQRLDQHINSEKKDFINARRVVNGTDRAREIAGYTQQYYNSLENYKPRNLTTSRTVVGQIMAGSGVLGSAVSEQAEVLAPLAGMSETVRNVFIVLTLVGIGLTLYARVDDWNKGKR